MSVFRRRLRASTSAGVSSRGVASACLLFLPFLCAASSARLPAIRAAISPTDGLWLPLLAPLAVPLLRAFAAAAAVVATGAASFGAFLSGLVAIALLGLPAIGLAATRAPAGALLDATTALGAEVLGLGACFLDGPALVAVFLAAGFAAGLAFFRAVVGECLAAGRLADAAGFLAAGLPDLPDLTEAPLRGPGFGLAAGDLRAGFACFLTMIILVSTAQLSKESREPTRGQRRPRSYMGAPRKTATYSACVPARPNPIVAGRTLTPGPAWPGISAPESAIPAPRWSALRTDVRAGSAIRADPPAPASAARRPAPASGPARAKGPGRRPTRVLPHTPRRGGFRQSAGSPRRSSILPAPRGNARSARPVPSPRDPPTAVAAGHGG